MCKKIRMCVCVCSCSVRMMKMEFELWVFVSEVCQPRVFQTADNMDVGAECVFSRIECYRVKTGTETSRWLGTLGTVTVLSNRNCLNMCVRSCVCSFFCILTCLCTCGVSVAGVLSASFVCLGLPRVCVTVYLWFYVRLNECEFAIVHIYAHVICVEMLVCMRNLLQIFLCILCVVFCECLCVSVWQQTHS